MTGITIYGTRAELEQALRILEQSAQEDAAETTRRIYAQAKRDQGKKKS